MDQPGRSDTSGNRLYTYLLFARYGFGHRFWMPFRSGEGASRPPHGLPHVVHFRTISGRTSQEFPAVRALYYDGRPRQDMRTRLMETVFRHAEAYASADRHEPTSDAGLYRAFVADGSHAAFAGLVHRHGPMVWGVCKNLLISEADAEDAFQATFLALMRLGQRLREPAAVGGWLHSAAVQVCRR